MKFTCRVCGGYLMSCTDGIRCGRCGRQPELTFALTDGSDAGAVVPTGASGLGTPKDTWKGIVAQIIDPREELNNRRKGLEGGR